MENIFLELSNLELFNVLIIDSEGLLSLILRFILNFTILSVIVKYLYLPNAKSNYYVFPFLMIGTSIFLLIFMLGAVKMKIGIALGLFAVFGIIRYRTLPVPIKEMTYLFTMVAISVINGMVSNKMSYAEILATNIIIVSVIAVIEKIWYKRQLTMKRIKYEKIHLITKKEEMIKDIEERIGISVSKIEIGDIDFQTDITKIKVYYYEY